MPCYFPLTAWRAPSVNKDTGKRPLVFQRSKGLSDLDALTVPCGNCIGCRIDKSRTWAIRCVHESKMHQDNCFVTLTYDDEHLPAGGSLVKSDLQKFFRALRDRGYSFRYFSCGEYGDGSQRPHYHALLFGIDFSEDRKLHSRSNSGFPQYTSKILTDTWGKGHATVSAFSYATAAYTARYVMKKVRGKNAPDDPVYSRINSATGELFQCEPEFALMSRRPGLGTTWYDKYKSDAFPSDFLVHDGKKHPVPRFYLEKLKMNDERTFKKIRGKRRLDRELLKHDNTADRLYTKMEVKKSKLSQLKRTI